MKELIRDSDGVFLAGMRENYFGGEPDVKIKERVMPTFQADPEKQIFVKSNFKTLNDDGGRVAFSERHEAHPNDGEAFVAGARPVKVALTARAAEALNTGLILACDDAEVTDFTNAKYTKARKILASQKEIFRRKFVALVGSENGFEKAWQESERGREAIQIVETAL
jgi:hypothetical protein